MGLPSLSLIGWKFESSQLADAVAIEPVSALTFPANREINREDLKFAQNEGERGHQDWAKAALGCRCYGLFSFVAIVILSLSRKLHDQNGVFRDQSHENHETDLGKDVDRHAPDAEAGG